MKYRISVTVSADRLGDAVQALAGIGPELTVYAIGDEQPEWGTYAAGRAEGEAMLKAIKASKAPSKTKAPTKRKKTFVLPGDVAGVERERPNRRAELLEAALRTGPKRWSELRAALSAGGLSESSLNNMIGGWKKIGKIARTQDGLWVLKDDQAQRADAG